MPQQASYYKPQTSRQAKRAAQKSSKTISDAERRKLARAHELHERAERLREKERRRQINAQKRKEKEQKDRETRRRMGTLDQNASKFPSSQQSLAKFWGSLGAGQKTSDEYKENIPDVVEHSENEDALLTDLEDQADETHGMSETSDVCKAGNLIDTANRKEPEIKIEDTASPREDSVTATDLPYNRLSSKPLQSPKAEPNCNDAESESLKVPRRSSSISPSAARSQDVGCVSKEKDTRVESRLSGQSNSIQGNSTQGRNNSNSPSPCMNAVSTLADDFILDDLEDFFVSGTQLQQELAKTSPSTPQQIQRKTSNDIEEKGLMLPPQAPQPKQPGSPVIPWISSQDLEFSEEDLRELLRNENASSVEAEKRTHHDTKPITNPETKSFKQKTASLEPLRTTTTPVAPNDANGSDSLFYTAEDFELSSQELRDLLS